MGSLITKIVEKTGNEKLATVYPTETTFFDFRMKDIDGQTVDFKNFRGRAKCFIVVNVASK
jgi:hypothetical protein